MEELIANIIEDLTSELNGIDPMFNADVLAVKVRYAALEVKQARRYPSTYSEDQIATDMNQFYSQIRNISLYDYNQVGIEFQSNHTEADTQRTYVDRNKLFGGVLPFTRC